MKFTEAQFDKGTVTLEEEMAFPKLLTQRWNHTIVYNVFLYCSITISILWN